MTFAIKPQSIYLAVALTYLKVKSVECLCLLLMVLVLFTSLVKRQKGANSDRLLRSVFTRSLDVDSFSVSQVLQQITLST